MELGGCGVRPCRLHDEAGRGRAVPAVGWIVVRDRCGDCRWLL